MFEEKIQQTTSQLNTRHCTRLCCFLLMIEKIKDAKHPQNNSQQQVSCYGAVGKIFTFLVLLCCQEVWSLGGDFLMGQGSLTHILTHLYCKGQERPSLMTAEAHLSPASSEELLPAPTGPGLTPAGMPTSFSTSSPITPARCFVWPCVSAEIVQPAKQPSL